MLTEAVAEESVPYRDGARVEAERQRLMEEQARHVERLERQLERKELKIEVDVEAIVGAVLEGLQIAGPMQQMQVDLKKTHAEVLQLRQELRSPAHLEAAELRRIAREIEEMKEIFLADHNSGRELRVHVENAVARCSEDALVTARAATEALDRLEAKLDHSEIHAAIHDSARFTKSVYTAIEESSGRLLDAFENSRQNSELLAAVRRIKLDDSQILEAIQNLRSAKLHSEDTPVEMKELLMSQHRQLLEAVRAGNYSERGLQGHSSMTSVLQRTVDNNHRNVMDAIKATKSDLMNALESIDFKVDHSEVIDVINGGHHAHRTLLEQIHESRFDHSPVLDALGNLEQHVHRVREEFGGWSSVNEKMDDHHRGMHEALRGLGEANGGRHGLRADHEVYEPIYAMLVEHITESNRGVIGSVESAKREHMEVLQALRQLVSEVHEKPDLSELHRAIHTCSRDTVKEVVAVIETAVDHSPLLEAIGSFELKGHSEVLAAIRQLRLDIHMEPDFTPVLRAISEIPSHIQATHPPPVLRSPERNTSPTGRQRFIVTLGNQPGHLGGSPIR